MLLSMSLMVVLFCGLCSTSSYHYKIHSYKDRRQCKYWQQSGCLLDVLEKICSPEEPIEKVIKDILNSNAAENLFFCCCPLPYKRCKPREMDQECYDHLKERFSYRSIKDISQTDVVRGVQHVRATLLSKDLHCLQYLSPVSPISACSKTSPMPLKRVDLICEMLLWQFEELGDGDKTEFKDINCPYIVENQATNGNARKGNNRDDGDINACDINDGDVNDGDINDSVVDDGDRNNGDSNGRDDGDINEAGIKHHSSSSQHLDYTKRNFPLEETGTSKDEL